MAQALLSYHVSSPRPQNTGEQHTGRTVSWETEGLVKTVKYHSQIYACGAVSWKGIK